MNQPFLPRVTHARRLFFELRLMLAAGTGGQVVRFLDQQQAFARRAQQRGPLLDRRIVAANRVALALLQASWAALLDEPVALPALRERADRRALIHQLFAAAGASAKGLRLDDGALAALQGHAWPGNVRELSSVLRSLVALADPGQCLALGDLPPYIRGAVATPSPARGDEARPDPQAVPAGELQAVARQAIGRALNACAGNVGLAARHLSVHRSTLYRHLARARQRA